MSIFKEYGQSDGEFLKLEVGGSETFMYDETRQITTQYGDAIVMDGRLSDQSKVTLLIKPQMATRLDEVLTELNLQEPEKGSLITVTRKDDVKTPNGSKHIHDFAYQSPGGAKPPEPAAAAAPAPEPAAPADASAFFAA